MNKLIAITILFTSVNLFAATSSSGSDCPAKPEAGKMIVLDGNEIKSIPQLHYEFSKSPLFPDYYGRNFDALSDVLNKDIKEAHILILHANQLHKNIGEANEMLMGILLDAQQYNKGVCVYF